MHPVGDIPLDIPLDEAALIEALSVGYHAYERSGARAGDFALITGAGPIGLLTAAVLKAQGLHVAVSETSELPAAAKPLKPESPTMSSTPPRRTS